MSEERHPAGEPADRRPDPAEEPDPTGVRAILAALPDPGPMPLDLVQRITASLAVERARCEVMARTDGSPSDGNATVRSLSTARERRPWGARLPLIAAAASIVVLAGAVVMGLFVMGSGLSVGASYDTAAEQAPGDSGAVAPEADEDSAAGSTAPFGNTEPFGSTEPAPQSEDGIDSQSMVTTAVPILATGAVLTGSTLAEHARSLRDGPATLGHDADAAVAMAASSVGTAQGAAGCLGELLSVPAERALRLVGGVDVVRFGGAFAAVILASDPGTQADSTRRPDVSTAYLVRLDCGPRAAVLLHDPVPIGS